MVSNHSTPPLPIQTASQAKWYTQVWNAIKGAINYLSCGWLCKRNDIPAAIHSQSYYGSYPHMEEGARGIPYLAAQLDPPSQQSEESQSVESESSSSLPDVSQAIPEPEQREPDVLPAAVPQQPQHNLISALPPDLQTHIISFADHKAASNLSNASKESGAIVRAEHPDYPTFHVHGIGQRALQAEPHMFEGNRKIHEHAVAIFSDRSEFQKRVTSSDHLIYLANFYPDYHQQLIDHLLADEDGITPEFQRLVRSDWNFLCIAEAFPNHREALINHLLANGGVEFYRLVTSYGFAKLGQIFPNHQQELMNLLLANTEIAETTFRDVVFDLKYLAGIAEAFPDYHQELVNYLLNRNEGIHFCRLVGKGDYMRGSLVMIMHEPGQYRLEPPHFRGGPIDIARMFPNHHELLMNHILTHHIGDENAFDKVVRGPFGLGALAKAFPSQQVKLVDYLVAHPEKREKLKPNRNNVPLLQGVFQQDQASRLEELGFFSATR